MREDAQGESDALGVWPDHVYPLPRRRVSDPTTHSSTPHSLVGTQQLCELKEDALEAGSNTSSCLDGMRPIQ
jgi:hypothetical protein